MLKDADNNATPTKYAQNKRQGIYGGMVSMMNLALQRCSAPKTAKGTAKHKLLRTMILSRPPARAISVFAPHSATKTSRMPALHIATAVREMSKNVARMVMCIWMLSVAHVLYLGYVFPRSIRLQIVQQRRVGEDIPRRANGRFSARVRPAFLSVVVARRRLQLRPPPWPAPRQ